MPALKDKVPSYRHHKGTGQAFVILNGSQIYLGKHGTKESRGEYERLIGQWLAAGRTFADRIIAIIREAGHVGISLTEWSNELGRNRSKMENDSAVDLLNTMNLIDIVATSHEGRTHDRYFERNT